MKRQVLSIVLLLASSGAGANVYEVPMLPGADNEDNNQGILRIQGAYPIDTTRQRIQIVAYDDTGALYGPVWLRLDNYQAVTLTSTDLEQGNAEKGLSEGIGDGSGHWRLVVTADDDFLDVRAYVRNLWGFGTIAPLYDLATTQNIYPGHPFPVHFVPMIQPRNNPFQTSLVRIYNRKNHFVRVVLNTPIFGAYGWCDIAPQAAVELDSTQLADLIDDAFASQDEFLADAWALTVRVLAEPGSPVAHGHCENGNVSEGAAPGEVDDIGVLSLTRDIYGNIASDSGPPTPVVAPDRAPRESTGQFDITVEFGEGFNEEWRQAILHSVARWEQVITADYPTSMASLQGCGIAHEASVDDLLIRFEWQGRTGHIGGAAATCGTVATPGFPAGRPNAGVIWMNPTYFGTQHVGDFMVVDRVVIHEVGHVLGIGTTWLETQMIDLDSIRPHFNGPKATEAFNRIMPRSAASARSRGVEGVPVEDDGAHWRSSAYAVDGIDGTYTVFDDIMLPGGNRTQQNEITEITIGALQDLGYSVDIDQAD